MGREDQAVSGEGLGEVVVKTIQVHFIGLAINNKAESFCHGIGEKKYPKTLTKIQSQYTRNFYFLGHSWPI